MSRDTITIDHWVSLSLAETGRKAQELLTKCTKDDSCQGSYGTVYEHPGIRMALQRFLDATTGSRERGENAVLVFGDIDVISVVITVTEQMKP
jgi:hypothetical protein